MTSFLRKHKFSIHSLLLILPVYFLYQSLNPVFPPSWQPQTISSIEFTPMPYDNDAPYLHHGVYVKDFLLMVNKGDIRNIRQAYLNIGPAALPLEQMKQQDEGIVHGSKHGLHAHAIAPESINTDDKLWLTVQEWDMKVYVTSWEIP